LIGARLMTRVVRAGRHVLMCRSTTEDCLARSILQIFTIAFQHFMVNLVLGDELKESDVPDAMRLLKLPFATGPMLVDTSDDKTRGI
jgi:hypothetical protein